MALRKPDSQEYNEFAKYVAKRTKNEFGVTTENEEEVKATINKSNDYCMLVDLN